MPYFRREKHAALCCRTTLRTHEGTVRRLFDCAKTRDRDVLHSAWNRCGLTGTKLEYDTPYGIIVLISMLALHDLDNVVNVPLEKRLFGRECVIFMNLGSDLAVYAKALSIVQ
jgi:hypothetical protein